MHLVCLSLGRVQTTWHTTYGTTCGRHCSCMLAGLLGMRATPCLDKRLRARAEQKEGQQAQAANMKLLRLKFALKRQ